MKLLPLQVALLAIVKNDLIRHDRFTGPERILL